MSFPALCSPVPAFVGSVAALRHDGGRHGAPAMLSWSCTIANPPRAAARARFRPRAVLVQSPFLGSAVCCPWPAGGPPDGRGPDGGSGGRGDGDGEPRRQVIEVPGLFGHSRYVRQTPSSAWDALDLGSTLRQFFHSIRLCHVILMLNVAFFIAQGVIGNQLLLAGAKVNADIARGQVHRLLSPMFLHASVSHLLVNCFSLYSTGPSVESWFGRARFVTLYLISGICGNLLSFLCTPTSSVGASGAIFGLVGATGVLLARHRHILGPRSQKGLNSLAYIVLVNFAMGMSPASRIDNFGHLGGLLGGVLFSFLAGPRLIETKAPNGNTVLVDRPLVKIAAAEVRAFTSRLFGVSGWGKG